MLGFVSEFVFDWQSHFLKVSTDVDNDNLERGKMTRCQ